MMTDLNWRVYDSRGNCVATADAMNVALAAAYLQAGPSRVMFRYSGTLWHEGHEEFSCNEDMDAALMIVHHRLSIYATQKLMRSYVPETVINEWGDEPMSYDRERHLIIVRPGQPGRVEVPASPEDVACFTGLCGCLESAHVPR